MGTKMHCPTHTRLITPQLDRAVVLNRRLGAFNFVPGSAERSAFDALQKAAEGDPAIRSPQSQERAGSLAKTRGSACAKSSSSTFRRLQTEITTLRNSLESYHGQ
jgi:hypothetical protein